MSDQLPPKVLIVIAPAVKLNKAVLQQIADAGYIVVRGQPFDFTVVGQQPPIEPLVLKAALDAIGAHFPDSDTAHGNGVRNRFARNLAGALGYANTVALK